MLARLRSHCERTEERERCLTETDIVQKDTVDKLESLVKLPTINPESATESAIQFSVL